MFSRKSILVGVMMGVASVSFAQAPVSDLEDSRSMRATTAGMEASMYQQLQQLRQEVMSLRGIVEEQSNQIRQLKQQSLDRYIDIDRRLSSLSNTGAATSGLGETLPAGADDVAADPAVEGGAVVAVSGNPVNTGAGNPSSDYARAYALVGAREYPQAIEAFTAYVKQYPDGEYTPNAWYWLGELYVAIDPQNLGAATEAFQQLLSTYPDNRKVPAAMYKLATVYFLQGDKQRAQELLTNVIDRYGNTGNSAVNKSREFLRKNF